MTRLEAVLLLLLILAAVYALMYFGWWRRTRRHPSAAVATAGAEHAGAGGIASRGTYISTTTDQSRFDRVATGGLTGLGVRSAATMLVDDEGVSYERQGAADLRLDRSRIETVRRDRGMAGKFIGQDRMVVVTWHGDPNDPVGDDGEEAVERFETGFLPRHAADAEALIGAVTRLLPQHTATTDGDQ
ncbi:PH-like domain-containing protein [Segeticoccus rhizosphaerae]|uniref:PH-like domain-containing protein n=1 Tax=Segeticoccus rhizosphaerae TaxID=1104777 RepID=UPI0010BFA96F|nr:hypothetical protein [Ornithinicoccus soli]